MVERASFELALSDEISGTRVLIPTFSITLAPTVDIGKSSVA